MISQDRLKELFHYDPETGLFTWIVFRGGGSPRIGTVAGSPNEDGYVKIKVDQKLYAAHRLAWLYMTGSFPSLEIDHINGQPADNRFSNLREASRTENNRNTKISKNNQSGFKRVTRNKKNGKWAAHIRSNDKQKFLGNFETPELAHEFYCLAADMLHGEFANYG